MFKRNALLVLLALAAGPAGAQDVRRELRPELDLYVSEGSRIRFIFQDSLTEATNTSYAKGAFTYFVELALKPVFRRNLRQEPDVFRRRFLTFRAGYEYTTTLVNGKASSENRSIIELTGRYPLPLGLVIIDRNRQEFRMIEGQNVSVRYRNRLWEERDLGFKAFTLTPYVYDEVSFDTRFHAWSSNRVAFGVQVPVATRFVLEPYLRRQTNHPGSPPQIQTLGFKLNVYF